MYGRGCIVLRDFPKTSVDIDGITVKLQGGFRGFDAVPPGEHQLVWKPDLGKEISLEVDLLPGDAIVCKMEYEGMTPTRLVELDASDRYWELALSGAMGFTLWTYPQAWKTLRDRAIVKEIFSRYNRLHFVLSDDYGLTADKIQDLRIAPNVVEFCTETRNYAFKLCPYTGDRFMLYLFVPAPQYPNCYDQKLDPALWSALYTLIDELGDFQED